MKTIRILSLDGGGIRGIFSATFLERFCNDAGINGNELWKYFDIICGTSIGGVGAIVYAYGKSPTEFIELLKGNAEDIFTIRSEIYPTKTLGPAGAATLGIVLAAPGYDPYIYNSQPFRDALSLVLKTTCMFQLKTNTLVTAVGFQGGTKSGNLVFPYGNITGSGYYHFSNISIPNFTIGQNCECVDIAMATGAAPVYFHPTTILGLRYNPDKHTYFIDGALYQNNPTGVGYMFSNILFPGNSKICILSVGTGSTTPSVEINTSSDNLKVNFDNGLSLLANNWNLTLDGAMDAVDRQFEIMSLYKGATNNLFYYRFQRLLEDQTLNQLDNPTKEAIAYLQSEALLQYNKDSIKIQQFIQNCNFQN